MTDVRVPTYVRGRPADLDRHEAEIATRVGTAAGAALVRAQEQLLSRKVKIETVALEPPKLRWTGVVAALEEQARGRLERGILDGLGTAIMSAELVVTDAPPAAAPPLDLAVFSTDEEAGKFVEHVFGDASPRGDLRLGTYATWADDALPHLFMVDAGERALVVRHWVLVQARLKGAEMVAEERMLPVFEPGKRYLLEARGEAGWSDPYPGRATEEGATTALRLYLHRDLHAHLSGRRLRIEVAAHRRHETVVRARRTRERRRVPAWAFRWQDYLPEEPLEGEPAWLWYWYCWFNARPASIRLNPYVREAFQDLEDEGARRDFNFLLLPHWYGVFYTRFSRRVALAMLEVSRANMEEALASMAGDPGRWLRRLESLVRWSEKPARVLSDIAHRRELEERLAVARAGMKPAGGVPDDPKALERRLAAAEAVSPPSARWELTRGTGAGGTVSGEEISLLALLQTVADTEPLLVLLRMRSGHDVRTLEDALAWAADAGPEETLDYVQRQLKELLRHNERGRRELLSDDESALKLRPIQDEARLQLQAWLTANAVLKGAADQLTSESMVKWLALAAIVAGLTLIFPPLGAVVGAGVALYAVGESATKAYRLTAFSRVRLAQSGFEAVVTQEEADEAVDQLLFDVLFAIADLGAAVKAVKEIGEKAAAARRLLAAEAAGATLRALDRRLIAWRRLELWPKRLVGEIEERVARFARELDVGAGDLNVLVRDVQAQLVRRLESQAEATTRRLREAIDAGLGPDEIGAWLRREHKDPSRAIEDLMGQDELMRRSVATAAGRRLRGVAPPALVDRLLSLPGAEELETIRRALGPLGAVVEAARVHRLAVAANLPTSVMVQRLRALLARAKSPEATLALLEAAVLGRRDGLAILRALEHVDAEAVLPLVRRELLELRLAGGHGELFEALRRRSALGETGAAFVERDAAGANQLLREVRAGKQTKLERWGGPLEGWADVVEPPRPALRLEDPSYLKRIATRTGFERLSTFARRLNETTVGRDFLQEVAKQPGKTPDGILLGLSHWTGVLETRPDRIQALTGFLKKGGDPEFLAELLITLDKRAKGRLGYVEDMVDLFDSLDAHQVEGVGVAFRQLRGGPEGAERVTNIVANLRPDTARDTFGRLADLADVEGLRGPISYLSRQPVGRSGRTSENVNVAALAQLAAVRDIQKEFPGHRIVFEAPEFRPGGVKIREVDVRVVSRLTGKPVLDVELKEISDLRWLREGHAQKQFARDLVRSLERSGGRIDLRDIRWLVNERAFLAQGMGRDDLIKELHKIFKNALDHSELTEYAAKQFTGGQQAFLDQLRAHLGDQKNFERIVRLF